MENQKIMKNIIFSLTLLISFSTFAQEEIILGVVRANEWNDVFDNFSDKSFAVKYNPKESKYYIKVDDWMNKAWIHFSPKEIESMRSVLNKFKEWNEIAISNSTKIEKEIPGGRYQCNVSWNAADNWYFSSSYMDVRFKIFSQSTKRHQLIIYSSKISSTENEYIDFKMPTLYLDLSDVLEFESVISEKNIQSKLEVFNKHKSKDDLFK